MNYNGAYNDTFHNMVKMLSAGIKKYKPAPFHLFMQGGMRSGKTYSAMQFCVLKALSSKEKIVGKIIAQSVPHLKEKMLFDLEEICRNYGINWKRNYRKQDRLLTVGGSYIWLLSVDEDKVLGGEHDFVYVNECNVRVFGWNTMEQVMSRTNGFGIYDFNPTAEFWYHENVVGDPRFNTDLFISTYRDNEFVSEGIKRTLEMSKEGTNFWKVFNQGMMGSHDGVIFPNWTRGEFDESLPFCFGVDFGAVDPDAVVKVAYDKKLNNLYVQEMYYQVGNGTEQLVRDLLRLRDAEIERREKLRRYPWSVANRNVPFICDSAGKKMIIDLAGAGINAIPCSKYPDSVRTEIRELQDVNIIVCGESPNLERELNNYIYNDKKSNTPIDSFNHLIDGIRYCWGWITGGANDGVHKR